VLVWLSIFILLFFHREILSFIISWVSHSEPVVDPKADIRLRAMFKRVPQVLLMETPLVESLGLSIFSRKQVFVSKGLWNKLSEAEQECMLCWFHSALEKVLTVKRLTGPFDRTSIDRDLMLMTSQPLAWVSLMEKASLERASSPPTAFGVLLSGLSLLGPSLFMNDTNQSQRAKAYAEQLTRLQQ